MTAVEQPSVTIPAFAAPTIPGESLTVFAPVDWHERIEALGAFTCYGETYRRAVVDNLRDLSHAVRNGYSASAYDRLLAAERAAGIKS